MVAEEAALGAGVRLSVPEGHCIASHKTARERPSEHLLAPPRQLDEGFPCLRSDTLVCVARIAGDRWFGGGVMSGRKNRKAVSELLDLQ